MGFSIRPTQREDGSALRHLEEAAGEQFRTVGLPDVADAEPPSLDVFTRYADANRSWVARVDANDDRAGNIVGFILVDQLDGLAHVEQVSVHPAHQGKGVGRALIDRAEAWAQTMSSDAVTLSTFIHVPWNAPLYRHLGFREMAEGERGPQLRERVRTESEHGLDPASRVCMWRHVATAVAPISTEPER
jgi:GNAT superfamily N-acetyltransferase